MPTQSTLSDPRLAELVRLREKARLSQQRVAHFLGLSDYNTVGAWERGESVPRESRREKFIAYLMGPLGLQANRTEFERVWHEVMVGVWGWEYWTDREIVVALDSLNLNRMNSLVQAAADEKNWLWQVPIADYGERLFGVEKQIEQLSEAFQRKLPWIIAVHGIGGVGKTALVNYTLRTLYRRSLLFERVVWVSARQQRLTGSGIIGSRSHIDLDQVFDTIGSGLGLNDVIRLPRLHKVSRLAAHLTNSPSLVVIDNLEAVEDYADLIPHLEIMADPSKFILTSRETVPALAAVKEIPLDELEENPSIDLINSLVRNLEQEGKTVGHFHPKDVYSLVGGNPLAIVLIVSQMQFFSPDVVLSGVREGDLEAIYRYIFWRSWSLLGEAPRSILRAIRRANDEADLDWLEMSTQLPRPQLISGLGRLRDLSLIRPLNEPNRFAIHRFTSTFLRIEVFGWK